MMTPEEIKNITFNSSFEELICLALDFRFFYYRLSSRNGDVPYNPRYLEDLLNSYQSVGDLTIKENMPELLYKIDNIFPGAHKTTIIQYFIAWSYLREIRCNFIVVSSTDNLAEKILIAVRHILIENPYITSLIDIKEKSFAKDKGKLELECNHPSDGVLKTVGAGGTFTGCNGNVPTLHHFSGCLICDDPHGAGDTSIQITNTVSSLMNSFTGRVRSQKTGIYIIAGQMVSSEDLSNYILNVYGKICKHFKIPALNRFNQSNYPQKFSTMELIIEKQKAIEGIGTDTFFLQKQQESDFAVTNYTLIENIQEIDSHEYNRMLQDDKSCRLIEKIISVDTSSILPKGDPAAICVMSAIEKYMPNNDKPMYLYFLEKIYNLTYTFFSDDDMVNGRKKQPNYNFKIEEVLERVINEEVKNNVKVVTLIEAGGSGTMLFDKMNGRYADVIKIPTNKSTNGYARGKVKFNRIQAVLTEFCKPGSMRFMAVKQPELEIFKKQLANIERRSVNDDIVDCVSMSLQYAHENECKNYFRSNAETITIYTN